MPETCSSLENYVTITQNNSKRYKPQDVISIGKRVNNPKRDFLLVNRVQGKHLHIDPSLSFGLFLELFNQIKSGINPSEKVVVIGFAETATAISQLIARALPNCIYYLQTTREFIPDAQRIVEFSEEHSHATEQFLYGNTNAYSALQSCNRVIFVDDEISTGNTVLNFISALKKISINPKYSVASILNLQNEEWSKKFSNNGIDCFFIFRGFLNNLNATVNVDVSTPSYIPKVNSAIKEITINSNFYLVDRTGFKPTSLADFYSLISFNIVEEISELLPSPNESVLVLGTEEFMFTPMAIANVIQSVTSCNVQFHATTRSPIEISSSSDYPVNTRFPVRSCYDISRQTYVYNLQPYDKVFIITDVIPNDGFMIDIASALSYSGCNADSIILLALSN